MGIGARSEWALGAQFCRRHRLSFMSAALHSSETSISVTTAIGCFLELLFFAIDVDYL